MNQITDRIFRALKERNYQTVDELAQRLDESQIAVQITLDMLVEVYNYLGCEDGRYYIKQVLDPIIYPGKVGYVRYHDVLTATAIPTEYMNPNVGQVVHRDQGSSPSCVGQSTAYGRDLDLIRLENQLPEEKDLVRVKRNVVYDETIWYDIYYRQSFSAEYAYRKSREVGNVTYPTGSYLPASLKSLKINGICLHDQWYNPKSGIAAWREPYPDYADFLGESASDTAPKHKISGYATVDLWADVKQAIYTHGYVLGSILVWENYARSPGDVNLPEPKGDTCGAHALCFVGYDENNLYFLHSWWGDKAKPEPEWNKVGAISRNYFNQGFLGGYVVLDDEEARIAFVEYVTVVFKSDVLPSADLYIDGEPKGTLPVTQVLKRGSQYTVELKDKPTGLNYRTVISIDTTASEPVKITLNPNLTLIDRVIAAIRRIWNLLAAVRKV